MVLPRLDAPVLIVGAGPVGAVLALELARHGVRCIVAERSPEPVPYPRTYYLNSRSMELLRRFGLTTAIRAQGVKPDDSTDVSWAPSFREPPVLVWHYPSVNQVRRRYAAVNDGTAPVEPYQRVSGVVLEELGRAKMRRARLVDYRECSTVVDLRPSGDRVMVDLVDGLDDRRHTLEVRYVAVCDGAGPAFRQCLDISMDERGPRRPYCSVHFHSTDPALRPFGNAFTTIAVDGLTLVSHGDRNEWTATMPADERSPSTNPITGIQTSLGTPFRVDRSFGVTWQDGTHSVVTEYRRGRVFLVGDSAHRFYPGAGYGENTGIADAIDLGWKLGATIKGWGGPALLASYEQERRPVALFNRELSADLVEVGRRFSRLATAGASREHLAGILEQDVHRLDDLGVQFGYRYDASPVVCHEDGDAPTWQWRRVTASTWPGTRVPAVRMANGAQLFDELGRGFTLVDLSGSGLGEPLVKTAAQRNVPMTHLRLDDAAVRACWERDLVLVRPDQHVAWRDDVPPEDPGAVLAHVTGYAGE